MTNKQIFGYVIAHMHMHGTDDPKEYREVVESLVQIFYKAEKYEELQQYEEFKELIKGSE